jgi:hypothetical protein
MALMMPLFSGCSYIADIILDAYEEKYSSDFLPHYQPMTKWETDDFELFVVNMYKGVLVCHFPDKTEIYDLVFSTHAMGIVYMLNENTKTEQSDSAHTTVDIIPPPSPDKCILFSAIVYGENFFSWTETSFEARFAPVTIDMGLFPSEDVIFRRTEVNLTEDDIPRPEIEKDESNPIFKIGSQWKNDTGLTIDMPKEYIRRLPEYTEYFYPIGKVNNLPYSNQEFSIIFSIFDSRAYIVSTPEQYSVYDITTAQEVWDCEFFEDYFIATVQESPYYEPGTILRFSLISE